MRLCTSLSKWECSRQAVFETTGAKSVNWAQNLYYEGVDSHFVALEVLDDPLVVVGRAFCNQLRSCGLLDGYSGPEDLKSDHQVQYQCDFAVVVKCDDQKVCLRAEMTYSVRRDSKALKAIDIDKEQINSWLYDLVFNEKDCDPIFDMKMKYMLELKLVRCFVDDLEIEV